MKVIQIGSELEAQIHH